MDEFEPRYAVILFADIVGCSEISNEHNIKDYAKILYQFYLSAHLAYKSVENFKLFKKEDCHFHYQGDEVCLFILLEKDTKDLRTDDCGDKIKAALRFSLALKFFWYLSKYNIKRLEEQLEPREIGIGVHVGLVAMQKAPPKLFECERDCAIEGYAINLAKRIEQSSHVAKETRIFLSSECKVLIGGFKDCKDLLEECGLEPKEVSIEAKNISSYRTAYELKRSEDKKNLPIGFFDKLAGKEELLELEEVKEILLKCEGNGRSQTFSERVETLRQKAQLYPDNFWLDRITRITKLEIQEKFEKIETEDVAYFRARIYYEDKEYGKAVKCFDQVKSNAKFMGDKKAAFEVRFCLGFSYYELKQYIDSVNEYEEANKLFPSNPGVIINWGNALQGLRKFEEAISKYEQLNKINPNDPITLMNWGVALGELGRFEEAISKYEQADNIRPNDPDTLKNWGIVLGGLRRFEEAISKYEQGDKISPNNPAILMNWGAALGDFRKFKEAISKFEQADKIRPNDPMTLMNWGAALGELGRFEEAISKYEQADKIMQNHPLIIMNLGIALARSGNPEAALAKLKRAYELAPDDPKIHSSYIIFLRVLGREKEADELEKKHGLKKAT